MTALASVGLRRCRARRSIMAALLALAGAAAGAAACTPVARPRDLAGDRRPQRLEADAGTAASEGGVPEPPRVVAQPVVAGRKARLFAQASSRALALDAVNVYYGDSEDDGIYALPKAGGTAVRIARHAPVAGAIALDGDAVIWIASPGDAVLRSSRVGGAQPVTLREHGIFADVAAAGGDVYIAEALGAGGALLRVTGATATAAGTSTRVATFDGPPRVVMTDANHSYVVTPTRVLRTAHGKSEIETLATGTGFTYAEMDDASIYLVAEDHRAGVVLRVAKAGGASTVIAQNVRNAPLEVAGAEVLFFDAVRPQLLVVPAAGGDARLVAEDEAFASPAALEADGTTVYVATGAHESGAILAIDRK